MSTLPETLPSYIDPNINLEKVRIECQELVKKRARISAGVGALPLPLIDLAVDTGLLTTLLPEISTRFHLLEPVNTSHVQPHNHGIKNIGSRLMSLASLAITRGVVKKTFQGFGGRLIGEQVAKYIPLGGTLVAATMSYMIFKKIAYNHIDECYKAAKEIQSRSI